jgi:hypothetical protein
MPVIFTNPSGAPELACEVCGCRWFDRMNDACYECGADVPEAEVAAFAAALERFYQDKGIDMSADPWLARQRSRERES